LTGTRFLDSPFYRTAAAYTLQVSTPGMTESLYFADCHTVARSFHPFFLKTAATHKQADVMDGVRRAFQVNAKAWGTRDFTWLALIADDPSIQGGDYTKLSTVAMLPDLGIAVMRDSWQDGAVAARFKCGPMGGYKANAWRETAKDDKGNLPYLNVAHDHPDANSFILYGDGDYMAETDRYPLNPGKLSSSHNTILINGLGQAVNGRPEGQDWQQPGNGDMTRMGKIVSFKEAGDVVVVEGEAAGSYLTYTDRKTGKSRPALDRFRRTFIWVKGDYVLVFDDVRSPEPVEVTYLMQGAKQEPVDEAQGRYRLSKNKAQCEFQLVADAPLETKIGASTANDHSKLLNWQQLQATAKGAAVRFASVFDPWHKKELKVTLTTDGPDKATLTVTGAGLNDTWQWQAAKGQFEAATWHGTRSGGFDVTVDARTAAPPSP
ncbi:MAG: heparinase II/III family protein, partial [Planctomycetes bacterium]|nr:heparinase II/III family protein [Planctomycetota bacterium]